MKFSWAWLRRHLDLADHTPQQVAERLDAVGVEVVAVESFGEDLVDLRVGHVEECGPHPDADKLSITRVAFGAEESVPVVCGAPNVRQGLRIAFAPVGSLIPGGIRLKPAKLRGQASQGMICSERELGLSENHAGIMELPDEAPIGTRLLDYLELNDLVLIVDDRILARRPDLGSHRGLAREIAACLGMDPIPESANAWPGALPQPQAAPADRPAGYIAAAIHRSPEPVATPWEVRRLLLAVGERFADPIAAWARFVTLDTGVRVDLLASRGQDPGATAWNAEARLPDGFEAAEDSEESQLLLQAVPDGSLEPMRQARAAMADLLGGVERAGLGSIAKLIEAAEIESDAVEFEFDPGRLPVIPVDDELPRWRRFGFEVREKRDDGRLRIVAPPWRSDFDAEDAATRFEFELVRMFGVDRIAAQPFAVSAPVGPSAVARLEARLRSALTDRFQGQERLCPPNQDPCDSLVAGEPAGQGRTGRVTRFAFGGGDEHEGHAQDSLPPGAGSSRARWLTVVHADASLNQPDGPCSPFGWARSLVESLAALTEVDPRAGYEVVAPESVPEAWHPGRCLQWRFDDESFAWSGEWDPRRPQGIAPASQRLALSCFDLNAWSRRIGPLVGGGHAAAQSIPGAAFDLTVQVPETLSFEAFAGAWSSSGLDKKISHWSLQDARLLEGESIRRWRLGLQWKSADKAPSVKESEAWLRKLDAWLESLDGLRIGD